MLDNNVKKKNYVRGRKWLKSHCIYIAKSHNTFINEDSQDFLAFVYSCYDIETIFVQMCTVVFKFTYQLFFFLCFFKIYQEIE